MSEPILRITMAKPQYIANSVAPATVAYIPALMTPPQFKEKVGGCAVAPALARLAPSQALRLSFQ